MFTGIVEEIGKVISFDLRSPAARLVISANLIIVDIKIGDSIAIDGVCLTVIAFKSNQFTLEVQQETINKTIVSGYKVGSFVNLERAVTPTTRLGGHYVQGHIDDVVKVASWHLEGKDWVLRAKLPERLRRYVVDKGFIAINGISLTVNGAIRSDGAFAVNIIPLTRSITSLQYLSVGSGLNIEVDILAKYVESMQT